MKKNEPYPIVVLISGNGSNLQAIIDAKQRGLNVNIMAVISNNAHAYGLERAKKAGIPAHVIPHQAFNDREAFDRKLREIIDRYQPKLIVLAGFMRRLGSTIVTHYLGRMINIHPSLLPKYRGLNTYQRALKAKDDYHGVSIHFVTDDLDGGPIIAQTALPILPSDTEDTLKERTQIIEHRMYPEVIRWFAEDRLKLQANQVALDGKLLPDTGRLIKL